MARLDLPDPRRDEDTRPGALPSADFRARQRVAAQAERAQVIYAAAVAQGKGGLLADLATEGLDIPDALLSTLAHVDLGSPRSKREMRLAAIRV